MEKLNEIVKETPSGSLSNSHYKKEETSSGEKRIRTRYDKKFPKRDFKKFENRSDVKEEKRRV